MNHVVFQMLGMIDKFAVKMKQCQIFTGESIFPVCCWNVWVGRLFSTFVLLHIFGLIFIWGVNILIYSDMSCVPQVCSVCCLNASEIGEESSANGKESLTDVDKQCVPCHTHEIRMITMITMILQYYQDVSF